ncbi:MAG: PRC-barrel domain-containing protein [Micropepsaceae bacterium]
MNRLMISAATIALLAPVGAAFGAAVPKEKPAQQSAQPADTMSEAWRSLQNGAYDAWQATAHAFDEMTRKSQQDLVVATALPGAISGKQLIGTPIESVKEGRVGSIADLVFGNDNRVDAIVVSDGGFLGINNAQIPVKPGLVSISREKNGTLRARTNVTEAQLDKASVGGAFVTRIEAMNESFKEAKMKTLSRLIGATVAGPGGKTVGTVNDVLLSPVGDAQFALLSVGGTMGVGSKQVAVKASTLQFTSADRPLKTEMTEVQLKALAPVRGATGASSASN